MRTSRRVALLCVVTATIGCASGSAGAATAGSISKVTFGQSPAAPEITVTGSGFGTVAPRPNPSAPVACGVSKPGHDYGTSLFLADTTQQWTAGRFIPNQETDCIGLIVDQWSDTQVAFHFDGYYAAHDYMLAPNDQVTVSVVGITRKTIVYAGDGGLLPFGPPGAYIDRAWPTAPAGGWSSLQTSVDVTRAPLTNPLADYYYASDWYLGVTGATPSTRFAYMGMQTKSTQLIAIASIFTTSTAEAETIATTPGTGTDGQPADCHVSPSEGSFVTCRINYSWHQGQTYRYSFARTAPSRWTASITNTATNTTTTLGAFTVPAGWTGIQPPTHSWIEQFVSPPETSRTTDPVCPAVRTTASFTNARLNGTIAPTSETPYISPLDAYLSLPRLTCQNATATRIANGATLDTDIPTPAPAPTARISATNGTVAWTAALVPSTITANTIAFFAPYPVLFAALAGFARPLPDAYIIKTTDEHGTAGPSKSVAATQRSATITLASGHTWTISVTATKNGNGSAPTPAGTYKP